MKILFLEDDILLNEIIQEHLENEGYSVKSTFTGYEAEPSIATIRTYIKNIRKHIDKNSLKTIKGLGYILKI